MELIQKQLNEIKELLAKQRLQQKEILTLEDVVEYLQLSKSCIYKLTSRKVIPHYIPGGKKIYFKKSEVDEWVFNSRVNSAVNMALDTENYLARNNENSAL